MTKKNEVNYRIVLISLKQIISLKLRKASFSLNSPLLKKSRVPVAMSVHQLKCPKATRYPRESNCRMTIDIPIKKLSYCEIVSDKSISPKVVNQFVEFEESPEHSKQGDESSISLSIVDKKRLYTPWLIIIKVVGKRFNHHYLKTKLSDL